ncbi:MAG: hypothetical protein ACLQBJ_06730 [Bryobacteraceae bacterium]
MRRLLVLGLACACALCAQAQTPKRRKGRQPIEKTVAAPYWFRYPQFTKAEVRLVANWFQDALEQGRHLAVAVPSAIMSQVHRGAKLTASAMSSLAPPPQELLAKLPPMPQGYQRLVAGTVLLIVKTDEQLIVDTLPFVAR